MNTMNGIAVSSIWTYNGPSLEEELAAVMAALESPMDEAAVAVKDRAIENFREHTPYPRVDSGATIQSGHVEKTGSQYIIQRDIVFGANAEAAEFGQSPGEGPLVQRRGRGPRARVRWLAEQNLQDWVDRHFFGNTPQELDQIGHNIAKHIEETGVPPSYAITRAADDEADPLSQALAASIAKVYA
jgi:hypothetical protein